MSHGSEADALLGLSVVCRSGALRCKQIGSVALAARGARGGGVGRAARAQGGRASVRARPRHGSVAEGPGGAAARHSRRRAQVARSQTRAPDRGGHRETARARAGRQGLRRGLLV